VRIFLYEFVTGGGCYSHVGSPRHASLLAEGRAMLSAIAADLSRLDDVKLDVLADACEGPSPLPACCRVHEVRSQADERRAIDELAAVADWTLLIAPEFQGHLAIRCRAVERAGGKLLGPDARFVALASDKHATAQRLAEMNVRVPQGIALEAGDRFPSDFLYPAVLKPRDGAGSLGVRRLHAACASHPVAVGPSRLEEYCAGTPASVALLCGPGRIESLVPCRQHLDGFAYLGGSLPMESCLARRARESAVRAVAALGATRGYVGVDLVLGDDPSGADDYVIEINPRLTTSYVGLRSLAQGNLAEAMIAVAEGRRVELCWKSGPIQFEASGAVRRLAAAGSV
jgi:tyramine---L-glutamate ligase